MIIRKIKGDNPFACVRHFDIGTVIQVRKISVPNRSKIQQDYLQCYYMLQSLINNERSSCLYEFNENSIKELVKKVKSEL